MLWDFFHEIRPGDIIVARQGLKRLAAVGTVLRGGYYEKQKNAEALGQEEAYSNHLDVRWHDAPRDKGFDKPVFRMPTVYGIPEDKFRELVGSTVEMPVRG